MTFSKLPYYPELTHFTVTHLFQVSSAFAATLLVIFGNDINRWAKRLTKRWAFILRILAFIVLCSAGYALFTHLLTQLLYLLLQKVGRPVLVLVIVGMFLCVGILAERRSHL